MHTTVASHARSVDIPVMPIALTKDSCLSVRTALISSMLTWSGPETLRCELCSSGKTGRARGSCQLPLMCRARKSKLHAFAGMQHCGGAQTQAHPLPGDWVSDRTPSVH